MINVMRQRLFTTLAALLVVATLVVAACWVQSHISPPMMRSHWISRLPNGNRVATVFKSDHGQFVVQMTILTPADELISPMHGTIGIDSPWHWKTLGFHFVKTPSSYPRRFVSVSIPYWFIMLTCAAVPAIWVYRWYKRRNSNPFACQHCGYDLRASAGQCPECGAENPGVSHNPPVKLSGQPSGVPASSGCTHDD